MDSFYSREELARLGLRAYGKNVRVSRKASIYGAENISLGSNVRVDDFCILSGHIEIGSYVHIAAYTAVYGGSDGVFIGDFANLSSRVSVYSLSDDYSGRTMTNPMVPEAYKSVSSAPVHIGRHAIIGATSVVLPGVNIAEGGSFGCFTLVNRDTEPWSIYVGVPAKKLRDRERGLLRLEKELLKEFDELNAKN